MYNTYIHNIQVWALMGKVEKRYQPKDAPPSPAPEVHEHTYVKQCCHACTHTTHALTRTHTHTHARLLLIKMRKWPLRHDFISSNEVISSFPHFLLLLLLLLLFRLLHHFLLHAGPGTTARGVAIFFCLGAGITAWRGSDLFLGACTTVDWVEEKKIRRRHLSAWR